RAGPLLQLLDAARLVGRVSAVVVQPVEPHSLGSALEAGRRGLIEPILVGDRALIVTAAADLGVSLEGVRIEQAAGDVAAAAMAVALVRAGEAAVLVKGLIHTDDLMRAVLDRELGLRTGRRLSHVFACYLPAQAYPKPLLISDGALNVAPDLATKRDIVQNAIDLARALGVQVPRVAILAAVETVNPTMQATLDAAALAKMAERGQIRGGVVDGPLAFDSAVSHQSRLTKSIHSPVAGEADVLVVPEITAGNIAVKALTHLAGAVTPGIVLGASVPIVLPSRADPPSARVASCAIAALLVHAAGSGAPGSRNATAAPATRSVKRASAAPG
ncbi:MAG: bifunctional enoyl-CoA hydratase/phosphate acetyltransferase, partial [Chloroflexota bacterium]